LLSFVLPLLYACSHPIEIVGEGDVWSTGGRTCTLEDYQGGQNSCSKNFVIGAYQETYYAVPRLGWKFHRWGNYCADASENACSFNVTEDTVLQFYGATVAPLQAIFTRLDTGEIDTVITGIEFDKQSIKSLAPGSDNWAVTWAADGEQYTTWGDGGGFGGTNQEGRVSMGVGRIEGTPESFIGTNIWGGYNAITPATFSGKSYGLLDIDNQLWMWKTGNASDNTAFEEQTLYLSIDGGITWQETGVSFTKKSFNGSFGFFAPTFLQFGPGYSDARDEYVYIYAPEVKTDDWNVQVPGEISLLRTLKNQLSDRSSYQFYAGVDSNNEPVWSPAIDDRKPVYTDQRGVMRTSATYNAGLKRYFIITQLVSRLKSEGAMIGIFEAPEPWGPWKEVLVDNAWDLGLQEGTKTVFWNFSNKWTSDDGLHFSLVYTGPGNDSFGTIRGKFTVVAEK
jgi:hypothetical protein